MAVQPIVGAGGSVGQHRRLAGRAQPRHRRHERRSGRSCALGRSTRLASRLVDGVLTVTASEHRSQLRNREAALERLAESCVRRSRRHPRRVGRRRQPAGRSNVGSAEKKRRARTKRCVAPTMIELPCDHDHHARAASPILALVLAGSALVGRRPPPPPTSRPTPGSSSAASAPAARSTLCHTLWKGRDVLQHDRREADRCRPNGRR